MIYSLAPWLTAAARLGANQLIVFIAEPALGVRAERADSALSRRARSAFADLLGG